MRGPPPPAEGALVHATSEGHCTWYELATTFLGEMEVSNAFVPCTTRDYPTLMGITLLSATMILLSNLITDLGYAIADPRIRYD